MKKKITGMILILMFVFVAFTGCGETSEPVVEAEPVEQEPEKIHICVSNNDFSEELNYVTEKYPEIEERTEIEILPETDFCKTVSQVLENEESETYPDIIVAPFEGINYLVESDKTISISELGISQQDCSRMYPYTIGVATDKEGNLKALTNEVHPGAFIYRKAIAKEILGCDDEKEVQSYLRDWETFTDTARHIYKASEGKTAMIASAHALDAVYATGREKNWIDNDSIVIPNHYNKYLDTRYALEKNKFALTFNSSDMEYYKSASGDKVFGFFVESDLFENNVARKPGYEGDWGICEGPQAYFKGGYWIFVTDKCSDRELAKNVLKTLCTDMSVLEKIRADKGLFVNDTKVMSNAMNSGKGNSKLLGGDYIKVLSKQAEKIDFVYCGQEDSALDKMFFELADSYINDTMDKTKLEEAFVSKADAYLHPVVTEEVTETEE